MPGRAPKGLPRDRVRRYALNAMREGRSIRLGEGAFLNRDTWLAAKPWERERLFALAQGLTHLDRVLLGRAACLVLGLPTFSRLDEVVLGHPRKKATGSRNVVVRCGGLKDRQFTVRRAQVNIRPATYDGVLVAVPRNTVADLAARMPVRPCLTDLPADVLAFAEAVVVADAHRRAHGCVVDLLARNTAQTTVAVASQLSESSLESLVEALFVVLGIRGWTQQVTIVDAGDPIGRVDFWFPAARLAVEVDGAVKYPDGPERTADMSAFRAIARVLDDAPAADSPTPCAEFGAPIIPGDGITAYARWERLPELVRERWAS